MISKTNKITLWGFFVLAIGYTPIAMTNVSIHKINSVSASPKSISGGASRSSACPLNSGGASLLGSKWHLSRIYSTSAPKKLGITMLVTNSALIGFGGCNKYAASFKRIGLTGFKVTTVHKTSQACLIKRSYKSGPTINVGDWEGQYLKTIRRMGSVQKKGQYLNFYDQNGRIAMVFTESK